VVAFLLSSLRTRAKNSFIFGGVPAREASVPSLAVSRNFINGTLTLLALCGLSVLLFPSEDAASTWKIGGLDLLVMQTADLAWEHG
jgi:hypothetical protein